MSTNPCQHGDAPRAMADVKLPALPPELRTIIFDRFGEEVALEIVSTIEEYATDTVELNRVVVDEARELDVIDADNGARKYPWTYRNQPGNIGAWVLGECAAKAKPGGDYIDRGLSLLQEMHLRGLGVVRVPALATLTAALAKE